MSNWKFFLANSDDMSINKDITKKIKEKTLNLSHNRSGNFSFTIPMNAENLEYTKCVQKCIICMKNNNVVWSGPLWTRSIDFVNEKLSLTSVGWFEILMNRYLWNDIPEYTSADEGYIVQQLLDIANTDHDTWVSWGGETATSKRTKKYEIWQSIGEEIINLSDLEDGFDLYVDPEDRKLYVHDSSEFVDRTEIPFGMNWGVNNVSNLVINEDGGEMRNRIQVVGSNAAVRQYDSNHASPDNSQEFNNVFTDVIQETEEPNIDILDAIANAEGAIKQWPITTYDIELKPQGVDSNPYELFEDYNIGDKIYITAQKSIEGENVRIDIEPRVFGATISIDDFGIERVSSLQTTFSGN